MKERRGTEVTSRGIWKTAYIVLNEAKDILVCSSYFEVRKTHSGTDAQETGWTARLNRGRWGRAGERSLSFVRKTAGQSHLRIKCDKWSTAEVSRAEDRVGGRLQWSWAQARGTPLDHTSGQSVFCTFFLASAMKANHGINTHTCLSLLAQLRCSCFCSTLSFWAPQQPSRHRAHLGWAVASLPRSLRKPVFTATSASLGERSWCCLSG